MGSTEPTYTGIINNFYKYSGCILYNDDKIYFNRRGLRDFKKHNYIPARGDVFDFKIRKSNKTIDKFEAYDIVINTYKQETKEHKDSIILGTSDVHIGLIQKLSVNKYQPGLIVTHNNNFEWRERPCFNEKCKVGDIIIFIGNETENTKKVNRWRFVNFDQDWEYIRTICCECCEVRFLWGCNCEKRDVRLEYAKLALDKKNVDLIKNPDTIKDLILLILQVDFGFWRKLEQFRPFFTKEEFDGLCLECYGVIKNNIYGDGLFPIVEFIFEKKYITFDSLPFERQTEFVDKCIGHLRCYFKDESHDNIFNTSHIKYEEAKGNSVITLNRYRDILNLSKIFSGYKRAYRYFLSEIVKNCDFESLFLLMYVEELDFMGEDINTCEIQLVERFFKDILKIDADKILSTVNQYHHYSSGYYGLSRSTIGNRKIYFWCGQLRRETPYSVDESKYLNYGVYDIIEMILGYNSIDDITKAKLLASVFSYANTELKKVLLENKDMKNYIVQNIWEDYYSIKGLKEYDESFYWDAFAKKYNELSGRTKLYLWLNDLSNRYDYATFYQFCHCLSNYERQIMNRKIKEHTRDDRFMAFLEKIPKAEKVECNDGVSVYKCKWRNLYYKDDEIIVFLDKENALPTFNWPGARAEWNWLTNEYLNRKRIGTITIYVENGVVTRIDGVEEIEEKIIIEDIRVRGSEKVRRKVTGKQVIRIIHNVAARNKCIDFLSQQPSDFNVIDIQELVSNQYGEIRRDLSFMFVIPNRGYAYIVWESIEYEKSKATYVFRSTIDRVEHDLKKIKECIESEMYIRSRLFKPSNDDGIRDELQFYARVNHDVKDYNIWEERLRGVLPFLK